MRRWWTNRSVGARWAVVVGGFAIALLVWGVADQLALERYRDDRQAHAISESEFESVTPEASAPELLARFGEPEDADTLDDPENSCLTYKELGAPLLHERTYRFCFENGTLTAKDFAPIEDPELLQGGIVEEVD